MLQEKGTWKTHISSAFKADVFTRTLGKEVSYMDYPVLQWTKFFDYPENIIDGEKSGIRELVWRRIKKVMQNDKGKSLIHLKIHPHNFYDKNYSKLIHWQGGKITEFPLTKHMI